MTGLFWEPKKKTYSKKKKVHVMPAINSDWKPCKPSKWPRLSDAKVIAIDTETYDPNLLTHGPGYARGDGHIVGFSVSVDKKHSWYFPLRHTVFKQDNVSFSKVKLWLKDNLCNSTALKMGANIQYDIGWFREEGIRIPGPYLDVQHVEALINEHRRVYSLDSLAKRYLKQGKVSEALYQWLAEYYGGVADGKQRKNIYKAPPALVGPYAEADAWEPLLIWKKQKKIIRQQGLEKVLALESRLIPLLIDMRFRGVKVNIRKAEEVSDQLIKREKKLQKKLNKIAGCEVNVGASATIKRAFDNNNLRYHYTEKGNPSFTKIFLQQHPSEVAKLIVEIRNVSKLRSTFIEGAILNKNKNGRIYSEFVQMKGDRGGAITGRFSSRNPNLQNQPSRDPIYGPMIRGLFEPDDGFSHWLRADASQIEYRFLAHFAVGKSASMIRDRYNADANTDFHTATKELIEQVTGIQLERKPTKSINFGLCYGMGKRKLTNSLGLSKQKGKELFEAYHKGVPFVKDTFNYYVEQAQKQGYVQTILGRRARFLKWEGKKFSDEDKKFYNNYHEAVKYEGMDVQRAFTHKSLNSVLQGSAADFMKLSMLKCYEEGVFDALGGVPHLTVHDEIDISCNIDSDYSVVQEMKHVMEHCMKLRVPLFMELESGKNWGSCKKLEV